MYGITNPPLEIAHNWRQTTVTMPARNFYEVDNNIFYPRLDFAGEKTGITGMEFPLLNYLIYLISLVFGYQHWYGRLINLLVSSIGIYFFYLLIKKYFKEKTAFNASIILLFSLWFVYTRKIMPSTFSTSLAIIAAYYGSNFFDRKSSFTNLFLYVILGLLATLSKIPAIFVFSLFVLFVFSKKYSVKQKTIFIGASTIILVPVVYWYFVWVPYLVEKYEFWHFFMGKSYIKGVSELVEHRNQALGRFYGDALKFVGFAMFLFGLYSAFRQQKKLLLYVFSIGFFAFLAIVFKSGINFAHHTYYVLPFVPFMALVSGFGIAQIKSPKFVIILLLAIAAENILNTKEDFFIKQKDLQLVNLESDLDKVSKKDDLIMINCAPNPTPFYFSHRKGWMAYSDEVLDKKHILNLKKKGLKYIVILKRAFGKDVPLKYNRVFDNADYSIYKI